jgi:hypothetical protein
LVTSLGNVIWANVTVSPHRALTRGGGFSAIVVSIGQKSPHITEPNELVAEVHDRMPALLKPEQFEAWLSREMTAKDPA